MQLSKLRSGESNVLVTELRVKTGFFWLWLRLIRVITFTGLQHKLHIFNSLRENMLFKMQESVNQLNS